MNAIVDFAAYRLRQDPAHGHPASTGLQRDAWEEKRNTRRLNEYHIKLAELRARRYCLAARTVRAIMCKYPSDAIDQALMRASRVISGGGTIECAVYHALAGNPDGPDAA